MAKGLSDSEYLDSKRQEAFDVIEDMLEEVTSELDNKFDRLKDDLQNIEEFSKNNVTGSGCLIG